MQQRRKYPHQMEAAARVLDQLTSREPTPSEPGSNLKRNKKNGAYRGVESGVVRDANDIIAEFDMSKEEFSSLFNECKFSLSIANDTVSGWNMDLDEISRRIGALSEAEIELAKTSFQRAILNRIIVRKVADGAL